MASSMTGVGSGEVQKNGSSVSVELKSVNNRFLEISCRLPSYLAPFESEIRIIARRHIQRGKLYVTVSVQTEAESSLGIRVDSRMAQSIRRLLDDVRKATGVEEEIHLEHVLQFSEIFESMKAENNHEETWLLVKEALGLALEDLKGMRKEEGAVLVADIVGRLDCLKENLKKIENIARKNVDVAYEKMTRRIQNMLKDIELNEDRLNTEIVLMADKMDVTEECIRLRSHYEMFQRILDEETTVGKKLNFLLQEMNREANTISNKAINTEISHLVVETKEEIEKLREQVQNLE